jgi:Tfp pilus assembly protein PilF
MIDTLAAGLGPAPRLAVNEPTQPELTPAREAYDKGIELAVKKQITEAKAQFQKAIDLDPKYADAYFRMGRCYLKEGNHDQAKAMFAKTLSIDPKYSAAKKELSRLAAKK